MIVLIASAALVVIGLAAALAFGAASRMSVRAADPVSSAGGIPLADGEIGSDDLARVRFDTAFRGYRMDQVDAVLDRLQARLAELEADTHPRSGGLASAGSAGDPFHAAVGDASGDPEGVDGAPRGGGGSVTAFPVVRRHDDDTPLGPVY